MAVQGKGLKHVCGRLGRNDPAVRAVIKYLQGVIPLPSGRKDVEKGLQF